MLFDIVSILKVAERWSILAQGPDRLVVSEVWSTASPPEAADVLIPVELLFAATFIQRLRISVISEHLVLK